MRLTGSSASGNPELLAGPRIWVGGKLAAHCPAGKHSGSRRSCCQYRARASPRVPDDVGRCFRQHAVSGWGRRPCRHRIDDRRNPVRPSSAGSRTFEKSRHTGDRVGRRGLLPGARSACCHEPLTPLACAVPELPERANGEHVLARETRQDDNDSERVARGFRGDLQAISRVRWHVRQNAEGVVAILLAVAVSPHPDHGTRSEGDVPWGQISHEFHPKTVGTGTREVPICAPGTSLRVRQSRVVSYHRAGRLGVANVG